MQLKEQIKSEKYKAMQEVSQKGIAKRLGISEAHLSNILAGRRKAKPDLLQKIKSVCNFTENPETKIINALILKHLKERVKEKNINRKMVLNLLEISKEEYSEIWNLRKSLNIEQLLKLALLMEERIWEFIIPLSKYDFKSSEKRCEIRNLEYFKRTIEKTGNRIKKLDEAINYLRVEKAKYEYEEMKIHLCIKSNKISKN